MSAGAPTQGRQVVVAPLLFDSAVDQRTMPDFGDEPGTRVLVFRTSELSMLIRCRTVENRVWLRGRVLPTGGHKIYMRVPGQVAVALGEPSDTTFAGELTRGLVSFEVLPGEAQVGPTVLTDWVVL
ncbi:MAG TPA: hypothetical protein VE990_11430 [Acidimicrobiales bacterium]|nr:hypothetical protein [Acidimicrobiales bacterium]